MFRYIVFCFSWPLRLCRCRPRGVGWGGGGVHLRRLKANPPFYLVSCPIQWHVSTVSGAYVPCFSGLGLSRGVFCLDLARLFCL